MGKGRTTEKNRESLKTKMGRRQEENKGGKGKTQHMRQ